MKNFETQKNERDFGDSQPASALCEPATPTLYNIFIYFLPVGKKIASLLFSVLLPGYKYPLININRAREEGNTMEELWKALDVPGYEISSLGRVYSIKRGKILSQRITGFGYKRVTMSHNGKMIHRFVHILVLENFIGSRPTPSHQGNHKDGVKSNNSVGNLEWATPSQNTQHAYDSNLIDLSSRQRNTVSIEEARRIRRLHSCGVSVDKLSITTGLKRRHVSSIVNRSILAEPLGYNSEVL